MYGSGLEGLFSVGALVFLLTAIILAAWKCVDIIVWLMSHLNVTIV